ncbi:MAG TPA: VOC family protein [Cyclobacteriaceae bacterium]|nr:VOC family protein [Cyclobacteriaceae bacterium]
MLKQKINPFLWFDSEAEDAAKFYVSVFSKRKGATKKSKIESISRYPIDSAQIGKPKGSVMVVCFTLEGQEFVAINAGPLFKFNEAISLSINCKTQAEVDYFWEKLIAGGGEESMCGWLKDKYGLSWQVSPVAVSKMTSDKNVKKASRAMDAMMKMRKIDIATIKKAYNQK